MMMFMIWYFPMENKVYEAECEKRFSHSVLYMELVDRVCVGKNG